MQSAERKEMARENIIEMNMYRVTVIENIYIYYNADQRIKRILYKESERERERAREQESKSAGKEVNKRA